MMQRLASSSKNLLLRPSLHGAVLARSPTATMPSSVRSFAAAREKLQNVMEDYRKANYGQELPSRFAKEVVGAADVDGDGFISVSEVEALMENIGAKDVLSEAEIEEVMTEMGSKEGPKGVPVADVAKYIKMSAKPGVGH